MFLRLFLLLTLIGHMGEDARDDAKLGGKGMANVLFVLFLLGVVIVVGLVVIMIMAMDGQFLNDHMRPLT